jgi:hypothetical protein
MQETGNKTLHTIDTAKTVLVPAELYENGLEENYLRFNGMMLAHGERAVASEPWNDIVAVIGISANVWNSIGHKYEKGEVEVASPLLRIATGRGLELERGHGSGDGYWSGDGSLNKDGGGSGNGRKWGHGKRAVNILLTAENVYIAVWEKRLRIAEVLPDPSKESLLYYLQVLGRDFKLRKFDIFVGGERAVEVVGVLKRYFDNVRAL